MSILNIAELDSVSPEVQAQLKARGIRDTADLLEACRASGGCARLAATIGVDSSLMSQLAGYAGLMRIRGVGLTYVKLLDAKGIGSPQTLALQSPEALRAALAEFNAERKMVGRVPTLAMVTGWVSKAKKMPDAAWL